MTKECMEARLTEYIQTHQNELDATRDNFPTRTGYRLADQIGLFGDLHFKNRAELLGMWNFIKKTPGNKRLDISHFRVEKEKPSLFLWNFHVHCPRAMKRIAKKPKTEETKLRDGERVRIGMYNGREYTVTTEGRILRPEGGYVSFMRRRRDRKTGQYNLLYCFKNNNNKLREIFIKCIVAKVFQIKNHDRLRPNDQTYGVELIDPARGNRPDNLVVHKRGSSIEQYRGYVRDDPNQWKQLPKETTIDEEATDEKSDETPGTNDVAYERSGHRVIRTHIETGEVVTFESVQAAARDRGYSTNGAGNPLYTVLQFDGTKDGYRYQYHPDNFQLRDGEILFSNTYLGGTIRFTNQCRVKSKTNQYHNERFHGGHINKKHGRRMISVETGGMPFARAVACTEDTLLAQARKMMVDHGLDEKLVIEATSCVWRCRDIARLCVDQGLPPLYMEVGHVDGDYTNDIPSNLQWYLRADHKKKIGAARAEAGVHKKYHLSGLMKINVDTDEVVKVYQSVREASRNGEMAAKNIELYITTGKADGNGYIWKYAPNYRKFGEEFRLLSIPGLRLPKTWVSNDGRYVVATVKRSYVSEGSDSGGYRVTNNSNYVHVMVASSFKFEQFIEKISSYTGDEFEDRLRSLFQGKYINNGDLKQFFIDNDITPKKIEVNHIDGDTMNNQASNLEWLFRDEHRAKDAKRRSNKLLTSSSKRRRTS